MWELTSLQSLALGSSRSYGSTAEQTHPPTPHRHLHEAHTLEGKDARGMQPHTRSRAPKEGVEGLETLRRELVLCFPQFPRAAMRKLAWEIGSQLGGPEERDD